ncbi:MAG: hypothetical protein Q8J78_05100 [Moraxellaceae bacterium]|nr:hypothetical protein [Moraxellaceae bacterium]
MMTPEENAARILGQIRLVWAGILGGAFMMAGLMYALSLEGGMAMLPAHPLWWVAIAAPLLPALLLLRRLRETEAEQARGNVPPQRLMTAYLLCWAVADAPVILGATLGMVTGNQGLIAAGLAVGVTLMLLARPDEARRR